MFDAFSSAYKILGMQRDLQECYEYLLVQTYFWRLERTAC